MKPGGSSPLLAPPPERFAGAASAGVCGAGAAASGAAWPIASESCSIKDFRTLTSAMTSSTVRPPAPGA